MFKHFENATGQKVLVNTDLITSVEPATGEGLWKLTFERGNSITVKYGGDAENFAYGLSKHKVDQLEALLVIAQVMAHPPRVATAGPGLVVPQ